jgi:hypothetical protein
MEAVVSGRAGVALLIDGPCLSSFYYDDPAVRVQRVPSDFRLLFGDATDLRFLENVTPASAAQELTKERNRATSLDMCLIALDPEFSARLRGEAIVELEALLGNPDIVEFLERILYARPLSAEVISMEPSGYPSGRVAPGRIVS